MLKVFASRTKERGQLSSSSSGGMFRVLAEKIISGGGAVICTVYNYESSQPEFILTQEREKLKEASGSKYIQSNPLEIFRQGVEFLKENPDRELLFTGTGCQAEGFRKYMEICGLGDRIYTAGLICFGVTSPGLWKEYVESLRREHGGKIMQVAFRDKRNGWEKPTAYVKTGGREISIQKYMRLYYDKCMLRPSCYQCPYTTLDRKVDLTIGDFWGIQKVLPDYYDPMGNSLVLIHSERGLALFEAVKEELDYRESRPEDCLQPALEHPAEISVHRESFWQDYQKKGIDYVMKKHLKYGLNFSGSFSGGSDSGFGSEDTMILAERMTGRMTLKEKICQMFVVAPESILAHHQSSVLAKSVLSRYPVGGICCYAYNLASVEQTKEMLGTLQSVSTRLTGRGLFICVDEEGGKVARAAEKLGTTAFQDMCVYGAEGDEREAYRIGWTLAKDLGRLGFNLNFAPVADVYVEGKAEFLEKRCFSRDPDRVARMVSHEIRGMLDGGIMCAPKHFPGHGSAEGDSHEELVESSRTVEELNEYDLKPFRAAAAAGAPMIMVGHILMSGIGDDMPASLSRKVITGLLRESLGYQGIIICDAIRMKAIRRQYGYSEAVVKAVEAGCDMVLGVLDIAAAVSAVKKAVKKGRISEETINKAVRRILSAKIQYGIIGGKFTRHGKCCGCTACCAVCPVDAISMVPDEEGFLYPETDMTRCISCGRCRQVCAFQRDWEKTRGRT